MLFHVPKLGFMVPGGFSWFFMVTGGFFMVSHCSRWVFMVFHGIRLVFHDSRWFFMVSHGSRLVFMLPGQFPWFLMVPDWFFMVPDWFFMVPGRFPWFYVVPGWFFIFHVESTPKLYSCPTIQSRPCWPYVGWLWPN